MRMESGAFGGCFGRMFFWNDVCADADIFLEERVLERSSTGSIGGGANHDLGLREIISN